jgi:two-component sensor histidine kinase
MGGLVLICALLGLTWAASAPIIEDIARFERYRLPRLQMLQAAKNSDLEASVALRNVLLVKDPALDKREMQRYLAASNAAELALQSFAVHASRAEEQELLRRTIAARDDLQAGREEAIRIDQQGGAANADELTRSLDATLDSYLAELQRLHDFQSGRVTGLIDEMAKRADNVKLLLTICGVVAALTLLFVAASWRAELQRQVRLRDLRISSLHSQKNALVAEVHHRIKNHLQGLLGLIETRQRESRDSAVVASLSMLREHVLALVGVHGMQARDPSRPIALKDLVREQLEMVRAGHPETKLALSEDDLLETATLSPDHAIPVALVVTELIVNAIKHGTGAPVRILVGADRQRRPYIAVRNALSGPIAMDWSQARGLGTGLSLVSTLSEGVGEVMQELSPEEITMTMVLAPLAAPEAN